MISDTQSWGDPAPEKKRLWITETLKHYASLSGLLRTLGAGILIASVSMFLFQGWSSSGDSERYLMLLAHTLVLAGAGVIIGYWVKESKGARLFLSLSLVSSLVNFAVLGGLVYSQVQWDDGLTLYPQFAHWRAGSVDQALVIAAAGGALLIPVAWIGFLSLARRSAGRLTMLFLLAGSTLLIPVRETAYVAGIVAAVTILLLLQVGKARRNDNTLATREGRFARFVLFLVPIILVGRGMVLYGADMMMFAVVSLLTFLVLREINRNPDLSASSVVAINRLSTLPALATAFGFTGVLIEGQWLHHALWIPAFAVALSAPLLEISMRSPSGGAGYRRLAAVVATLSMVANLMVFPGLVTALISIAVGLAVTILGYSEKQRLALVSGLTAFLSGVIHQCYIAFHTFDLGSWGALAVMGITVIVAGSLLERHGAVIKARLTNWRQSLRQWQN